MTNQQWQVLLDIVNGKTPEKPVTGFIIDSPWFPCWTGITTLQFYFEHSMKEIRQLAGPEVALIGNLPPCDVLAAGTPEQVCEETRKMVHEFENRTTDPSQPPQRGGEVPLWGI